MKVMIMKDSIQVGLRPIYFSTATGDCGLIGRKQQFSTRLNFSLSLDTVFTSTVSALAAADNNTTLPRLCLISAKPSTHYYSESRVHVTYANFDGVSFTRD